MISESPLQKINKFNIPTLEKLIVDCISGDELFATQQNDLDYIVQTAFERYNINPGKIKPMHQWVITSFITKVP